MGFVAQYVRLLERAWPAVFLFWVGCLVWGAIEGPAFISSTDNTIAATKGS
jgi:hypothetical protein